MIVFCGGMQKSGTSWYFNMINDLLVTGGWDDMREVRERCDLGSGARMRPNGSFGEPKLRRVWALVDAHKQGYRFAAKTHYPPNWLVKRYIKLGVIAPVYIYRDPRDVALSAFDHGKRVRDEGETHTFGQLKTMEIAIQRAHKWVRWAEIWLSMPETHSVQYEQLMADPVAELERTAAFLDIGTSSLHLDEIVAQYKPDAIQGNAKLSDTLHLNKAKTRRFEEEMSDEHQALCRRLFGRQLIQWGYDEAAAAK